MKSENDTTLKTEIEFLWDGYQYVKFDPPPDLPPLPQSLRTAWLWFAAQVHMMQTLELL